LPMPAIGIIMFIEFYMGCRIKKLRGK